MEFKDALTAISVLVSAGALLYAWRKDRLLRSREHADRIRRAVGNVAARIERYGAIVWSYFDEIQPVITEADGQLVKEQNPLAVRDTLWRGLVTQRAELDRRLLAEEVEIAYVDLFGYDPRIHALFNDALTRLRLASRDAYESTLENTQNVTLSQVKQSEGFLSGALGNQLRSVCGEIAHELSVTLIEVTSAVVAELMILASAPDRAIVNHEVEIGSPASVFKSVLQSRQREAGNVQVVFYAFKGGVGRSLPVVRYGAALRHSRTESLANDRVEANCFHWAKRETMPSRKASNFGVKLARPGFGPAAELPTFSPA
jgi:hypothetical protein